MVFFYIQMNKQITSKFYPFDQSSYSYINLSTSSYTYVNFAGIIRLGIKSIFQ